MSLSSSLPVELGDGVHVRLLEAGDAQALAAAYVRNREHLTQWEPTRTKAFYTAEGQREGVRALLGDFDEGTAVPLVIAEGERIIGRLTISGIVRGAFQNGNVGYWTDAESTGRGLMTATVGLAAHLSRTELGLHRLQAATLLHNEASQRVLLGSGFVRYGMAPNYLQIAGRWQDHILFQRILHD